MGKLTLAFVLCSLAMLALPSNAKAQYGYGGGYYTQPYYGYQPYGYGSYYGTGYYTPYQVQVLTNLSYLEQVRQAQVQLQYQQLQLQQLYQQQYYQPYYYQRHR